MNEQTHREFTLKNELPALRQLCEQLESFCVDQGLGPKVIYALNLCVEELVVNLIAYAYSDGASHDIHLYIDHQPEGLLITLSDDGVAFNPWAAGEQDAERAHAGQGGLGLGLVKAQLDWSDYERREGWNLVRFRIQVS